MLEPTYNPTPRELYDDVCAAYGMARRLTTIRQCAPETYKERSWFIWKVLYNCANYIRATQAEEEGGCGCSPR